MILGSCRGCVKSGVDYYPFGLAFNSYQRENSVFNKYLYNAGSELQDDLGLNVFETYYRMLDPALGRWWQVDPKVDDFYDWTPYNYAYNNPSTKNDPKGDCTECMDFLKGAADGFVGTFTGIADAVTNPKQTVQNIKEALSNPDTYINSSLDGATMGMYSAVKNGGEFANNISSGDFNEAGKAFGEKGAQLAIAIVTEGAGRALGPKGIVYERIDKTGNLKPYVGQAKNGERYAARQKEHARANPDSDFSFKVIDKGRPGKNLNIKEQKALDARGGPTNKSNPNGGTSNQRNVIKKTKTAQ